MFQALISRLRDITMLGPDDPELVQAKLTAFTRQVPLMYGLVMVNTLALSVTHYNSAPALLTLYVPGALFAICLIRIATWWGESKRVRTHAEAIQRLRISVVFAGLLGFGFSAWSLTLFPYGDAYAQGHVAFFMAVTVIGCGFCLMHLRSAALLVTAVVMVPFTIFFGSSGNLALISIAINFVLVVIVVDFMVLVNYNTFAKGVETQKALLAKQIELHDLNEVNFHNAQIDSLTELPNRRSFFAELEQRLAAATQSGDILFVGILDLDGFKAINDVHGHHIGDRLLVEVSKRLRQGLEPKIFLARLGGDEFVIIGSGGATRQSVTETGDSIAAMLVAPFEIDARVIRIGCSIGFAIFLSAAKTAEDLFERADYALYFVKQNHRGSAVVFSAEHEATIREASLIDQALINADLERELWIAYQPVVDAADAACRPVSFEALARWRSPVLGDIPPIRFITAAERSGAIARLTPILLRKALEGAAAWPKGMRLSFNLSAVDVASSLSVLKIIDIIERSGIAPSRIDLEITETAVMQNHVLAAEALAALKTLGVQISLDDFGTGYSSLSYLRELPLDKIKIDRSFILDIETDPTSRMILKTMVGLCRNLGLDCIVEGVETQQQRDLLRDEGCRLMQGYLFARPMIGADVHGYLAAFSRQAVATAGGHV